MHLRLTRAQFDAVDYALLRQVDTHCAAHVALVDACRVAHAKPGGQVVITLDASTARWLATHHVALARRIATALRD